MDFNNVEETEQIKKQLTKKVAHLREEIQSSDPQLVPYLKDKLDLLESELNLLTEEAGENLNYVPAKDFSSR